MECRTWSKVFTRRQGMHAHRFLPNSLGTSAWFSTLIYVLVTRSLGFSSASGRPMPLDVQLVVHLAPS